MIERNPLGCRCPGAVFLAKLKPWPDIHWDAWAQRRHLDKEEAEPLATQEDGLCDACRESCSKKAFGLRERMIETGVIQG